MQIKTFSIPVIGGEQITEELNRFLRAKKILKVEKELVVLGQVGFWCFCVSYLDETPATFKDRGKIDYRLELDEVTFARFARLREIRKQISLAEGIPAYVIFNDEELAIMAKTPDLTIAKMREIKGIGDKKLEKYGQQFILPADEKSK